MARAVFAALSVALAGGLLGCDPPQKVEAPVPAPTDSAAVGACAGPGSFADLAERADAAVAYIETVQASPTDGGSHGLGSGFVIDKNGILLTNNHVIRGASEIYVVLKDNRLKAEVIGRDPPTDIALLKVAAQNLPELPLGNSAKMRVGDWVVAIGNPFGLAHTVSAGIVSAKGRTRHDVDLDPAGYYNFLQTDASINPGNSGGPLLDLQGRVVGINTAIRAGANDIGFAIPIDMVKALLPSLLREGKLRRSALGVVVESVEPRRAKELDIRGGAVVTEVVPGGPADAAGLRARDIVLAFEGEPVEGKESLRWLASIAGVGHQAQLKVKRGPRIFEITVKLSELSE
ncbi:MAG: hypothetical protein RJA70_2757 [Pseudomonadota bacterium]|jgi:serine protease Do